MELKALSRMQRIGAAIYVLDSLITDYPTPSLPVNPTDSTGDAYLQYVRECTNYDEHIRQSTRVASILEALMMLQEYEGGC